MQILLNQSELNQAAVEYVQSMLGLDHARTISVELTDDGATILIDEDHSEHQTGNTGEGQVGGQTKTRRSRRTKAQIEADRKAEEEQEAKASAPSTGEAGKSEDSQPVSGEAQGNVDSTQTTSAEAASNTQAASNEGAGTQAEAQVQPTDELPSDVTPQATNLEAEAELTPEVQTEEPVQQKPTTSLFANLRRPNNAAS